MERGRLGFHITSTLGIEELEERVREALAGEGFGVLSEIDVQATLRDRIGKDIGPYRILGACNPRFADQALELWRGIGVLLPCNVVLYDAGEHRVAQAFDPLAMTSLVEDPDLRPVAEEAAAALERAMRAVEEVAPAPAG
jgi:uncharacterized protein (DUF302 family)